jgi:hypothetical protein
MKIQNAVVVGVIALTLGNAQAALFDRGGGLLYDDVLNVTWLADANYAKTSGYDADGVMTWAAANTWAANLTFHDSVRNVDYSDWRLAANTPVGANWNYNYAINGSTDVGFNITSPHSELSYMYYVNLGLKSVATSAKYGVHGNGTQGGQANIGPVHNLQSGVYWSGTDYAPTPANYAWRFDTGGGYQGGGVESNGYFAWAVRPGDVAAPIPEPETYAMMFAGLGLLGVAARRRKQNLTA